MKKRSYKTPKGGNFRTYFHGSRVTNGSTFHRLADHARDGEKVERCGLDRGQG